MNYRIPKWYIEGDLKKTCEAFFGLVAKRYSDPQIAAFFEVPETTIKGFITKKIPDEMAAFRETLPSDHPRAANRDIRAQWLINDNREDTTAFITQQIINGVSRTEISAILTEKSGITVTNAMVHSYIANHMNVNFTQARIDKDLNDDNRLFSIHIVGSKPEALDKLMGAA